MRYFFHVACDDIRYEDDSGEDFPSVEIALAHADRIAAELRGDDPNCHAVILADENGNEVARVPIKGN